MAVERSELIRKIGEIRWVARQNLEKAQIFLNEIEIKKPEFIRPGQQDPYDPVVIANNLIIPFLVSVIEEYFRALFVFLLSHDRKKLSKFETILINKKDRLKILEGTLTREEAIARKLKFQKLKEIYKNFKEIDCRLEISKFLSLPPKNGNRTAHDLFAYLINKRHDLIHGNSIDKSYTQAKAKQDLEEIITGINQVNMEILQIYALESSVNPKIPDKSSSRK